MFCLLLTLVAPAVEPATPTAGVPTLPPPQSPATSHRLIVELESPPLTVWYKTAYGAQSAGGRLDVQSSASQSYAAQLEAEQAAFVAAMGSVLPDASVSTYVNELGHSVQNTYQTVLNGLAVDPGTADTTAAMKALLQITGVKAVYPDFAHAPTLYASLPLIDAPAAWNHAAIGGQANAGAGVKVASMDGGAHRDAPMFDGAGYSYPPGFPIGLTANTNGKIIASRVYFRPWDPPAPGDENPWPGENGTSHGVHTASIAAGNPVVADYLGITQTLSGVAPAAWVMSYRVFYYSVTGDGSFYTAEGLSALEDIVRDGADVLNNSWGVGPESAGGQLDPLDAALINAANAGIFVSMATGNSGPHRGTVDHPSSEYISVAASTTGGAYAYGRLNVIAPEPISPTLQAISYGRGLFGASLPLGQSITHTFASALSVDPANLTGCDAWTGAPFTGKAALISRGACHFSQQVYYAEQAGAELVVIYNNAGDGLRNMTCGAFCNPGQINIASIFIGQSYGEAMVSWHAVHGEAAVLEIDTRAYQAGNTPDIIASFSSRGPGVGNVLKPDIAAPGVNILAQGFTPGATGEARHLGYGQSGGTSMAAPHVAGAAALLQQIHPDWSNADIKSALMSTARYTDVYNYDGSPAQPLDMGAGRLDLTHAADPGVILNPPSLSFGTVPTGSIESLSVMVTNVATQTETYDLSALYTGDGFAITQTGDLPGFTVNPISLTLAPGASRIITVTFDSAMGLGIGDNQGYIILDGDPHHAHMPAWARVLPPPAAADILLIDHDYNWLLGLTDYRSYYTSTLDELGLTYHIWDAGDYYFDPATIPDAATLSAYDTVIYFTGDNWYPDGYYTIAPQLTEYANDGGTLIAMGQDITWVMASTNPDYAQFFYKFVLGGKCLQDSVTQYALPVLPIIPFPDAPSAFDGISLNLGGWEAEMVGLYGANQVPPVSTTTRGEAWLTYHAATQELEYSIDIYATDPVTITAASIHSGTAGLNGPVLYQLFVGPEYVTDTLSFAGSVTLTDTGQVLLFDGNLYVNVKSTANPAGEIRGQVVAAVVGDGAGNQTYVDEIEPVPFHPEKTQEGFMPLFMYPGDDNLQEGVVAMAHRDQPSLERPGISYFGRSIYTAFGLEGVNNGLDSTGREELLATFLDWAMDEPTVTISDVTIANASLLTTLEATLTSNITGTQGVNYRWDFGDGSEFADSYTSNLASHQYDTCGPYTVRVEAADSWGNRTVGAREGFNPCYAGATLTPTVAASSGAPGTQVEYTLRLTNTGATTDTFEITYAGNVWNVSLPVTSATLAAAESIGLIGYVDIPAGAQEGEADIITIKVASRKDPRVTAESRLTTFTSITECEVYLPIVVNR